MAVILNVLQACGCGCGFGCGCGEVGWVGLGTRCAALHKALGAGYVLTASGACEGAKCAVLPTRGVLLKKGGQPLRVEQLVLQLLGPRLRE